MTDCKYCEHPDHGKWLCDYPIVKSACLCVRTIERGHLEYSQAIDDEQGMQLIGNTFDDSNIASAGIADTPGAYLVSRWTTDWERA